MPRCDQGIIIGADTEFERRYWCSLEEGHEGPHIDHDVGAFGNGFAWDLDPPWKGDPDLPEWYFVQW